MVPERCEYRRDLRGRLPFAVHDLGRSLAGAALQVDARESEVVYVGFAVHARPSFAEDASSGKVAFMLPVRYPARSSDTNRKPNPLNAETIS